MEIQEVKSSSKFVTVETLPKSDDDPGFEFKVDLDVSRFTETRPFNGTVVLSTDSQRCPKAMVRIRAKYLAPVTIEPGTIVIASDQQGQVERELLVTTICPSIIRGATCPTGAIRTEFNEEKKLREHLVRLFVSSSREKSLDSKIEFELELFPNGGQSIVRAVHVPVYRFLEKGE